jgi:hypothetical protein
MKHMVPKMAKKSVKKKSHTRPKKLPALTPLARQIVSYVMTNIALGNDHDCCSTEEMVAEFGRAPERFRTTINKLVKQGYGQRT